MKLQQLQLLQFVYTKPANIRGGINWLQPQPRKYIIRKKTLSSVLCNFPCSVNRIPSIIAAVSCLQRMEEDMLKLLPTYLLNVQFCKAKKKTETKFGRTKKKVTVCINVNIQFKIHSNHRIRITLPTTTK